MGRPMSDIRIRIVYSSSDPHCLLARIGIESFSRITGANVSVTEERFKDSDQSDQRPRMYVDCNEGEHGLKVTGVPNIYGLLARLSEGTPGL